MIARKRSETILDTKILIVFKGLPFLGMYPVLLNFVLLFLKLFLKVYEPFHAYFAFTPIHLHQIFQILSQMSGYKAMVIEGKTGCGKSTQV